MLTAAVRDLHRCYPNQFLIDVRTSCPALWQNNPHLTRLDETDASVEQIKCEYPLIHRSNQEPVHFLQGFTEFLNERLGLRMRVTEFRGDIHISEQEKRWFSRVQEIKGANTPFWILASGGKWDYTIKWWSSERYQQVVDHYRGRCRGGPSTNLAGERAETRSDATDESHFATETPRIESQARWQFLLPLSGSACAMSAVSSTVVFRRAVHQAALHPGPAQVSCRLRELELEEFRRQRCDPFADRICQRWFAV